MLRATLTLAWLLGSGLAAAQPDAPQALAQKSDCMACHGMVHKQIGPGFAQIAARYRGDAEPIDPRAGHIPGAINRDWAGAQDAAGHWLGGPQQAERLAVGGAPVIFYCGSGVSAAANLLALVQAGRTPGPDTQLYAGSWSDWVSADERPAEVGP